MNSDTNILYLKTRTLSDSKNNIVGNVSSGCFRPIVPKSTRKQVFNVLMLFSFWNKLLLNYSHKVQRHNKAPLKTFFLLTIDLIGPLNKSHGYCHTLTIADRFTRWCKAIPLRNIETNTIVNAFILHWVASFGCHLIITCDRGRQFMSNLWHLLCEF